MKNLFFPFLILVFTTTASAQRVDLDKFSFAAAYRNFPTDPLPDSYKTYNVRIEAASTVGNVYDDGIEIAGLRRVDGTGHITVLAMLDDIIIERTETKERVEVKKDKQGVETRLSRFSFEMTYSFAARATVYDYKGETFMSNYRLYDRNDKKTYRTAEYNSATDAANAYNSKLIEIQHNLVQQLVENSLNSLQQILNARYGYTVQKVNDILWILNNRKHAEYDGHQKAWNNFRNTIAQMDPDRPVSLLKEKLKPSIEYFEKVKTKYTTSSKEDRKLRYASYYNLSKIYLYLDEPEKAMEEADALSMNDFDERDGKYLRAMAEELAYVFKKNNVRSRHFAIDIASYDSPVK